MNNKALYRISEKGEVAHYYTEYAGGFSDPFHTASFLSRLDIDDGDEDGMGENL